MNFYSLIVINCECFSLQIYSKVSFLMFCSGNECVIFVVVL